MSHPGCGTDLLCCQAAVRSKAEETIGWLRQSDKVPVARSCCCATCETNLGILCCSWCDARGAV
eukprot:1416895-Rhodomonas_salina.1